MNKSIDIILATYQGSAYLEELLTSIFSQTHQLFHLFIRDDGSNDSTLNILRKWTQRHPKKITLLPRSASLGIKGNFSELMRHSQAPYLMFADQDDKWLPRKMESSLIQMKTLEREYGSHVPLLLHTDLKVVDRHLKEIAPSFWKYAGIDPLDPEAIKLNRLLTQNIFTGCTLLINRPLINLAYPIPEESVMHDWWIGLVAACFGHIHSFDQPTVLYRQHSQNDIGAKSYSLKSFFSRMLKPASKKQANLCSTCKQARYFLNRYEGLLQERKEKRIILQAYGDLESHPYLKQKIQMIKHQFFKHGFLRNIKALCQKHT